MSRGDRDLIYRRAREKALHRYGSALDRGDFDTVAAVLREAENDPELERMILELNQALQAEYEDDRHNRDAEKVDQLAREHILSGLGGNFEEVDLPPLTVAEVIARIKSDVAVRGSVMCEVMTTAESLAEVQAPLPDALSQAAVRQLLDGLGAPINKPFLKLFRDTAIFLAMGREQGNARFAAARRERERGRSKTQDSSYKQEPSQ